MDAAGHTSASARRRSASSVVAAALLALSGAAGCSLTDRAPDPVDTAGTLASGLAAADVSRLPFDGSTGQAATLSVRTAYGDLVSTPRTVTVTGVTKEPGDDAKATATLGWTWDLPGTQDWTYTTTARLALSSDRTWHVAWSPSIVEPKLTATERLVSERVQPPRADITGAGGAALMTARDVYRVGVDKGRIPPEQAGPSATALAQLLGIEPAGYAATVTQAGPKAFVVAVTLRVDDPLLAGKSATIAAIPGGVRIPDRAVLGPTPGFARAILGTVGPATAEIVQKSAGRIAAGDTVGLSGLQQRYDPQLGGIPGLKIRAVGTDSAGAAIRRDLFAQDPVPGSPLAVTLQVAAQQAAETALAGQTTVPAALVAIRPSTGEVVAAAASPGAAGSALATTGRAAPGSTFKIVTSLALLRAGLTPDSPLACDPMFTVDGRPFKNYPDYPADKIGPITLRTALAQSCNTAFISQADKVSQDDLVAAAAALGVGVDFDMGLPAFLGSVPAQATKTEHAASMIGQGKVEMAALDMAVVVASVVKGSTVVPVLVQRPPAAAPTTTPGVSTAPATPKVATAPTSGGAATPGAATPGAAPTTAATPGTSPGTASATAAPTASLPTAPPAPAKPLTPAEAEALRSMLGSVVADGSGRGLASVGVTMAKTGTAEYGTDVPAKTHTWMVAARGDLAIAVFVQDGESGSKTAGPLVAAFLTTVGDLAGG